MRAVEGWGDRLIMSNTDNTTVHTVGQKRNDNFYDNRNLIIGSYRYSCKSNRMTK
jgi:hypothetical protein